MCFRSISLAPWQGFSATPGMGMEGGGKQGPICVPSITQYLILLALHVVLMIIYLFYDRKSSTICFFNLFGPLAGNFCHTGDGDGGSGEIETNICSIHHPFFLFSMTHSQTASPNKVAKTTSGTIQIHIYIYV